MFWKVSTVLFAFLALGAVLLALRCSETLKCDDLVNYEDGSVVCEIVVVGSEY